MGSVPVNQFHVFEFRLALGRNGTSPTMKDLPSELAIARSIGAPHVDLAVTLFWSSFALGWRLAHDVQKLLMAVIVCSMISLCPTVMVVVPMMPLSRVS